MSNPIYTSVPTETRAADDLAELALNLRWAWNHSSDELWGRLDPELWELTQNPPLKLAAYFSMEYMLSEALPIYSGGLGNVAGDQLKAANDLGLPIVAIGLLYSDRVLSAGDRLSRNAARAVSV